MNPQDFDKGFFDWLGGGDEVPWGDEPRIALLLMTEALGSACPLWTRMRQLVLDLSGNLDAPL